MDFRGQLLTYSPSTLIQSGQTNKQTNKQTHTQQSSFNNKDKPIIALHCDYIVYLSTITVRLIVIIKSRFF